METYPVRVCELLVGLPEVNAGVDPGVDVSRCLRGSRELR